MCKESIEERMKHQRAFDVKIEIEHSLFLVK